MNPKPKTRAEVADYILFTDGACSGNPGPGGWASILVNNHEKVTEMGGYDPATTNNRMELIAVCWGLEQVPRGSTVKVVTDSMYVIQGGSQWINGWKFRNWQTQEGKDVANKDLWIRFLEAKESIKLSWGYVRGHTGHPANERCDELAVEFSKGKHPELYRGPLNGYAVSVELPENMELPPQRSQSRSKSSKPTPFYLSLVDGELRRHEKWAECQNRVAGRSRARFRKVHNEDEVRAVCQEWGVDPTRLSTN